MTDFHHRLEEEIPRLRRYARALTRNAVQADDLVQETLTRALRKEHLWQPGTDLRAWLFTIMHNLNVNEVRRLAKDGTLIDIAEWSSKLTATTDPTASRQLQELDRAIAQLPEDQRQVLLLVGLEGMDYEGTAAVLSIPVGTVRSRLSRGRELLRKLMGVEKPPRQVGRPKRSAGVAAMPPCTRKRADGRSTRRLSVRSRRLPENAAVLIKPRTLAPEP